MTTEAADPQRLILESQGLVRSLALSIHRKSFGQHDLDDLISYGQLGLAQAAGEFDPNRGNQFSTYAYYRIRGAIYDGIAKMTWSSRVVAQREAAFDAVLERDNEEHPPRSTEPSVSEGTSWVTSVAEQLALVHLMTRGDGDIADAVPDQKAELPITELCREESCRKLKLVLSRLDEESAELIQMTYFQNMTLQEAADKLEISKSWACRLHAKTLKQLAAMLRDEGISES